MTRLFGTAHVAGGVMALLLLLAPLAATLAGWHLRVVDGGSMEPTLSRGDVIVVRPLDGKPSLGDLVTVETARGSYTHRLVGETGDRWILRGDANAADDPRSVETDQLLGITRHHLSGVSAAAVRISRSVPGRIALTVLALVALNPATGRRRDVSRERRAGGPPPPPPSVR